MRYASYAALAGLALAGGARADVTVVEEMTMDALITKIHTTSTERTTTDKQRRDSNGKMDGPLGFLAGSMRSGDIIRLDRDLTWHLDPDKKSYQETLFPTPEQRALAQQKMQEMLDKMKQCPAGPAQPKQEQPASGCEKTEPKFNVAKTDETAVIAGHSARKTLLSMTYSCKDVKTGSTCDFVASSELWLAQDPVNGLAERRSFAESHMKKLGLDVTSAQVRGQVLQAMAPYMDQLKQLSSKAGDLKGTPLRTLFAVSMGGPQCASAKSSGQDAGAGSGSASGSSSDSRPTSVGALGTKLLGGFLGKKLEPKPDEATPATASADPTMKTLMSLKTEITSVSTDTIASSEFDLPAGWRKIEPTPGKDRDQEFRCPKTGS